MSYSNEFLTDFKPIYLGILQAKQIPPEKAMLEAIDENADDVQKFEPEDIKSVLKQIAEEINFLTIYTERPAYFGEFAETMYEENGLLVMFCSKKCLREKKYVYVTPESGKKLIFDFEWQGDYYEQQMSQGKHYIPIYKKPWEKAENLDIAVPIGYNTVIVKRPRDIRKKPYKDRFEEAFYSE